jgi:hypothetical protein
MNKKYTVKNRNTGKVQNRKFASRAAARMFKRESGFKYDILNLATGTVVR